MRVTDGHSHAVPTYAETQLQNYVLLMQNLAEMKSHPYKSLNVHLPLEVQHPTVYPDVGKGLRFVRFGEVLKKLLQIKLFWENAPELNYGSWDLKHGQTDWSLVPTNIDLCLDTGHLMLGAGSDEAARERIQTVFLGRSDQIKHLHIHENDLVHDNHDLIGRVITPALFTLLTANRTYIFEKGIPDSEA